MTHVEAWQIVSGLVEESGAIIGVRLHPPAKPGSADHHKWTWDLRDFNDETMAFVVYCSDVPYPNNQEYITLPVTLIVSDKPQAIAVVVDKISKLKSLIK